MQTSRKKTEYRRIVNGHYGVPCGPKKARLMWVAGKILFLGRGLNFFFNFTPHPNNCMQNIVFVPRFKIFVFFNFMSPKNIIVYFSNFTNRCVSRDNCSWALPPQIEAPWEALQRGKSRCRRCPVRWGMGKDILVLPTMGSWAPQKGTEALTGNAFWRSLKATEHRTLLFAPICWCFEFVSGKAEVGGNLAPSLFICIKI